MQNAKPYNRYKHLAKQYRKPDKVSHAFYRRAAWRNARKAYIKQLEQKQREEIPTLDTVDQKKLELLLSVPVCEDCYKGFLIGYKPGIRTGKEVHHIKHVNPTNPMDTQGIYGEPLDPDNLVLLCKHCHNQRHGR